MTLLDAVDDFIDNESIHHNYGKFALENLHK